MFSATFPQTVRSLARQFMDNAAFLSLSEDQIHVAETSHQMVLASSMEKDRILIRLIEFENPDSAIIFCNTKQRTHYVAIVLQRFGYNADELSGDMDQRSRERVMNKLREGQLRFLVATDVAARGIDISDLSHVFQYEVPDDPEQYIHRAGRTGRAGATGIAITLADPFLDQIPLKKIEKQYSLVFEERPCPTDEELATLVGERLTIQLEKKLAERDNLKIERMQRFVPLVKELVEDEHGLALIAMLLDDHYQQTLHTPPSGIQPIGTVGKQHTTSSSSSSGKKNNRRRSRGGRGKKS
jgi:ATP-dependent RNA helicase DeaD